MSDDTREFTRSNRGGRWVSLFFVFGPADTSVLCDTKACMLVCSMHLLIGEALQAQQNGESGNHTHTDMCPTQHHVHDQALEVRESCVCATKYAVKGFFAMDSVGWTHLVHV
jgi:hypothetical protein